MLNLIYTIFKDYWASRVRLKVNHEFSVVNLENDYGTHLRFKEVRIVTVTNMSSFNVTLSKLTLTSGRGRKSIEVHYTPDGIDFAEDPPLPCRLEPRETFTFTIALSAIRKWDADDDVLAATVRTECGYTKKAKSAKTANLYTRTPFFETMPNYTTHKEELFDKQRHRCAACFEITPFEDLNEVLKVPRPKGSGEFSNLRLICGSCNSRDEPTISDLGTRPLLRDELPF